MNFLKLILFAALALSVAGCREELPPASSNAAPASMGSNKTDAPALRPSATQAQPRLQTVKLWIGTNELNTELALTLPQIETGMMWRTNMAEMDGMLFVFARPHQTSFWMRNTLLPLSCAYINPDGIILELHDMKPKDESSILASTDQVQYVLEVNQGWFKRHNVSEGMLVKTERGTLSQTFFRR
jgi:uncharacterized membrane protein (UPF0127 family)